MNAPVDLIELFPVISAAFEMGKTVKLHASGYSMSPLLKSGRDVIILSRCENPNKLKKYDVPLYFRDEKTLVLHRIVRVHSDCFDMCGDGESEIEKGISKDKIAAIAIGFIKNGKIIDTRNILYKIYSIIWCSIIPWRKYVFALYSKIIGKKK